jgi:4-alpha-glucanotransferase
VTGEELRALARRHGIELAYRGIGGTYHEASDASLEAVMAALDPGYEEPRSPGAAAAAADRGGVIVLWDGRWEDPIFHLGHCDRVDWRLLDEDGAVESEGTTEWTTAVLWDGVEIGGGGIVPPVAELPTGYHWLERRLVSDGWPARDDDWIRTLVISAPRRAHEEPGERYLGVWTSLVALRGELDWGTGTVFDLLALGEAIGAHGARIVGTLPLYAAFSEPDHSEVSPYQPVSRRFWNELFLTLPELPEWPAIADAAEHAGLIAPTGELADPAATMQVKRPLLETALASVEPPRAEAFAAYRREHPMLEEYARFRAAVETLGASWHAWPEPARSGDLSAVELPAAAVDYHAYVQWCMADQLAAVRERLAARGLVTYLDLPIGVHPDGFDAWREQDLFVAGMSLGAPPDALAKQGQDWGFRPLHPQRIREAGYQYLRECYRELMRYAGAVRIDHILGLHRQFWVPDGLGGANGVYVNVPTDELYALLVVESHRAGALVIGEDLGNVPDGVHEKMDEHALARSFVAQFSFRPDEADVLEQPAVNALATLDTHDTPTLRGFLEGGDIELRRRLGITTDEEAEDEQRGRWKLRRSLTAFLEREGAGAVDEDDAHAIADALLVRLASSPAFIVLASLDDLLGVAEPFNVPGTSSEYPNWRRRSPASLAAIASDERIAAVLRRAAEARTGR